MAVEPASHSILASASDSIYGEPGDLRLDVVEMVREATRSYPRFAALRERCKTAKRWRVTLAELGVSQTKVQLALGVSEQRLRRLLSGEEVPTEHEVEAVEALLASRSLGACRKPDQPPPPPLPEHLADAQRAAEDRRIAVRRVRAQAWRRKLNAAGLSVRQAAELTGMSLSRATYVLSKGRRPTAEEVEVLERVLGP